MREAVHPCPRADEPQKKARRHDRSDDVACRLRERDAQRQQPELAGKQIPDQHAGPPAQPAEVEHRDPEAGGRPERTRRACEQQRLACLRKGVIASGDQGHAPHKTQGGAGARVATSAPGQPQNSAVENRMLH
jgi:hypothetical protein